MESDSAIITNLVDVGCDEECKHSCRITKKEKIRMVFIYSVVITAITPLSANTVFLEERKTIPDILRMKDCIQGKSKNSTLSLSRCPHVDKFQLGEEIFVRICVRGKTISIDVRGYKGHYPTLEGIEWNGYILRSM